LGVAAIGEVKKASMWALLSSSNTYYRPIEKFVNTIY
jgi:hypothetical protein